MSTRANQLGPLWWDWAGISYCLLLAVFVVYRLTTTLPDVGAATVWQIVRDQFNDAKQRMASEAIVKKEKDVRDIMNKKMIPFATRITFRFCVELLILALGAGFLTGMSIDVSLGARVLGYSSTSACGLFLFIITAWRCGQASCRWFSSSSLSKENSIRQLLRELETQTNAEDDIEGNRSRHLSSDEHEITAGVDTHPGSPGQGRKPRKRFILLVILLFLLRYLLDKLVFPVFNFFVGSWFTRTVLLTIVQSCITGELWTEQRKWSEARRRVFGLEPCDLEWNETGGVFGVRSSRQRRRRDCENGGEESSTGTTSRFRAD